MEKYEYEVFGVIAKMSYSKNEEFTVEQICIDSRYSSITCFYFDENCIPKTETVNINNAISFQDKNTLKKLTIDDVIDEYSKRLYSMDELADIERHTEDKLYQ